MATRTTVRAGLSALVASAVLLLAGCTSSPVADPTNSSPSTSASSPSNTSSPASSTQLTTSSPVTSSSTVPETSPSARQGPSDLPPDHVTHAPAASAAYVGYSEMVDRAYADPGKDWSSEAAQWATDPAKSSLLQNLAGTAALGQYTSGAIELHPTVVKVETGLVTISDCVDSTNTDFFDSTGQSIKAPDVPGSYFRHVSEAQVALYETGQWLVTFITDDYNTTC